MKKLHPLWLATAAVLLVSTTQAEKSALSAPQKSDFPVKQQIPATPSKQQAYAGYLGMGVDRVKPSIKAHYPDEIDKALGVIVTRFADKSPAADDGIKLYDILIAYDEQSIKDPGQFIKKVRSYKPGRVVKFKLVRQGKVLTVPVTIGGQKRVRRTAPVARYPQIPDDYWEAPKKPVISGQAQPVPTPLPNQAPVPGSGINPQSPNAFDGLAIRKISGDIYDASIGVTAWDGTRQRRSFKGTREQILRQIMTARDLPPEARQQLLFAVKPRKKKSSGWGGMPFGDGNMFDPGRFFDGFGF